MGHFRNRRCYRLTILLLFVISSIVLVENRIEAFVPVNGAVEPLRAQKAVPLCGQAADYSIPEIVAEVKRACAGASLIGRGSAVYIDFAAHDGRVDGFAVIKGGIADMKASGAISIRDRGRFDFSLSVKGDDFSVEIRQGGGSLKASGIFSDNGALSVKLKAVHVKVNGCDVSFEARVKNRAVTVPGAFKIGRIEGELEAFGITVKGRPVPDISSHYAVADDILNVSGMRVGHGLTVSGSILLKKPNTLGLVVTADNVSLNRILVELGAGSVAPGLSGTLNGRFALKGPAAKPAIDARFDVRKGSMGSLEFDSLSASVRGEVPYMKIDDATIVRKSGRMELYGEFDLRNIGKNSFFGSIQTQADDSALTWDDLSVDGRGATETKMSKNVTSDIGVRYRKYGREGRIDESVRDSDEVRLEYKLSPNESLGLMLGQDNDYLGFEHRDKF